MLDSLLRNAGPPTLDLRLTEVDLPPLVGFTRLSAGTYRDSAGVRQTAADNVARRDHSAAGVPRGLLIEGARTNLLLNSAVLATQSANVTAQAYALSFEGTGTVTLSGASAAGPLVGTGASDRVSLSFTPAAGSLTLTVAGDVTAANLEAGAYATSWIPTTGAAATRAAELPILSGAAFASIYNPLEGTFVYEFMTSDTGVDHAVFSADNGTLANRWTAFTSRPLLESASVNVFGPTAAVPAPFTVVKDAAATKADDFAWSRGGGAVVTDTSGAMPIGVNALRLGYSPGGVTYLNGWLRRLRYWPRRLPNELLRALSA